MKAAKNEAGFALLFLLLQNVVKPEVCLIDTGKEKKARERSQWLKGGDLRSKYYPSLGRTTRAILCSEAVGHGGFCLTASAGCRGRTPALPAGRNALLQIFFKIFERVYCATLDKSSRTVI